MLKKLFILALLISAIVGIIYAQGVLIVEEEDGTPSVAGVWKIVVTNASMTDQGGGVIKLAYTAAEEPAGSVLLESASDVMLLESASDKALLEG